MDKSRPPSLLGATLCRNSLRPHRAFQIGKSLRIGQGEIKSAIICGHGVGIEGTSRSIWPRHTAKAATGDLHAITIEWKAMKVNGSYDFSFNALNQKIKEHRGGVDIKHIPHRIFQPQPDCILRRSWLLEVE